MNSLSRSIGTVHRQERVVINVVAQCDMLEISVTPTPCPSNLPNGLLELQKVSKLAGANR